MDVYERLIRNIPDFPIKGIRFRDITPLLSDGEGFHQTIMDLNKELPSYDQYDKFIVAESRGFIFGAPLASMNNKGLVLARKSGKLPLVGHKVSYALEYGTASIEIAEGNIKPGDRVIIMDDLIATGGSARAMVDLVREAGGIPVLALFLCELRSLQGYKQLGIPCKAIVSYGLHTGDLLQIKKSSKDDAIVKFVGKAEGEDEIKCMTKDNEEIIVRKQDICNIVMEDSEGCLTYIRYRD